MHDVGTKLHAWFGNQLVRTGLTSYGGLGHHGGDVLGPVEGHGASHLDIGGVAARREGHDRGIVDDLLCLHLIGHVALGAEEKQNKPKTR